MTIRRMTFRSTLLLCAFLACSCGERVRPAPRAESTPANARIVSLIPSATLIVFRLGAGDRLVGVTRYCERPEAARAIPRVGGILDVSVEAVAETRPDVVIGSPAVLKGRLVEILHPAGVSFLPIEFEDFDDVRRSILAIGQATGTDAEAARLVDDFDRGLDSLATGMPRRRTLFVGTRPLVVAGPSSFQGQLMSAMGLENVVDSATVTFPTWSIEQVLKARPELIIDGIAGGEPSAGILTDSGIDAPVVHIPDEAILLPGPDAVAAAAALAAEIRIVLDRGGKR